MANDGTGESTVFQVNVELVRDSAVKGIRLQDKIPFNITQQGCNDFPSHRFLSWITVPNIGPFQGAKDPIGMVAFKLVMPPFRPRVHPAGQRASVTLRTILPWQPA
jgi:hypothetical protein